MDIIMKAEMEHVTYAGLKEKADVSIMALKPLSILKRLMKQVVCLHADLTM